MGPTTDDLDLRGARRVLDEDHFDLDKVKERIVEFLAVAKLKGDVSGPILCFVGPPGVGKTSLGQSIARALGRRFVRTALGGVRDEAEIRGHRRTYVGAMPGTILRALRDAESMQSRLPRRRDRQARRRLPRRPGERHARGARPRAELVPRPLPRPAVRPLEVLFICTANQVETIPPALLDRMDVIQLSGYTEAEKLGIARRYLVPKQLEAHGLEPQAVFTETLRLVAREYTREAGVRNLERQIATLCARPPPRWRAAGARVPDRRAQVAVARAAALRGEGDGRPSRASRRGSP